MVPFVVNNDPIFKPYLLLMKHLVIQKLISLRYVWTRSISLFLIMCFFLLRVHILILLFVIKLILYFPKKCKTFINSVLMFVNLLGMKQWSAKVELNCLVVRNKGSPLLGLLFETHKFCCWMKQLQLWTLRVKRLCRKLWIMSGKKLQKMTFKKVVC